MLGFRLYKQDLNKSDRIQDDEAVPMETVLCLGGDEAIQSVQTNKRSEVIQRINVINSSGTEMRLLRVKRKCSEVDRKRGRTL